MRVEYSIQDLRFAHSEASAWLARWQAWARAVTSPFVRLPVVGSGAVQGRRLGLHVEVEHRQSAAVDTRAQTNALIVGPGRGEETRVRLA